MISTVRWLSPHRARSSAAPVYSFLGNDHIVLCGTVVYACQKSAILILSHHPIRKGLGKSGVDDMDMVVLVNNIDLFVPKGFPATSNKGLAFVWQGVQAP